MLDMLNCAEQYKCLNTHTMLKNLKQRHYTLRHLSKTHTSQHYNRVKKLHTSLH